MENLPLAKKVALVTGASRGIGRAIAFELKERNNFVVGTSTTQEGANGITESLGNDGIGMVLNVVDEDSIARLFQAIASDYELPTVLVNNAAVARDNLAVRMKVEEWEEVMNTNLNGVYRVTKNCLRTMMRARWGRIVNISSVVGSMGNPGQSNYAAAKAGLEGYSRALAAELASRNITVNCVAPGFIATDMTRDLSDQQRELLLARVPLGRLGEASEVASLVGFLTSEQAGYVTGETIHINGGLYMS